MKKSVKNNRNSAELGTMLALGLISSAVQAGASIYNTKKQIDAQNKAAEDARLAQVKANNLANNTTEQQNVMASINNSLTNPNNRIIPTQTSQLKLGGRRCKKVGGKKSFIGKCI